MRRSSAPSAIASRNNAAAASASGAGSALPPFVHKSAAPAAASAASALTAPGSPAPSPPVVGLPRWQGDISKKSWKREETNAAAREATQRKRARREQEAQSATASSGGGNGDASSSAAAAASSSSASPAKPAAASASASLFDPADDFLDSIDVDAVVSSTIKPPTDADPAAAAPKEKEGSESPPMAVGLSAAKIAFLQKRAAAAAAAAAATSGSAVNKASAAASSSSSSSAAASSASASASSNSAAASSSGATALPAFSPAKPKLYEQPRGSGIAPVKKPPGSTQAAAASEKSERYFNVGFCARSLKKHKNYDDGVLIVCGRRCTLKNMSAQTVSTALVSFSTDGLQEGSFYQIASSEVELGTPIPEEEYLSGRVFVGSIAAAAPAAPTAPPKQITTPFARLKASSAARSSGADSALPAAALAALLADPLALLLNRDGVTRGERAVVVDTFLSKQLRTHQRDGVEFMYRCVMGIVSPHHEGCILADEMGLGKTLQAITLLYTLLHYSPTKPKGECSKAIVVCPATLLNNWNKEFTKWLGSHRLRPVVLAASLNAADQTARVRDFLSGSGKDYAVLIVSYELFRKHAATLSELSSPLLICDEGHRLKSTSSNKTITALNKLRTKKRIMLTGTPVQNDLGEFFAMCDFVNPAIMGSLSAFRRTFEIPISRSRDTSADFKTKQLGEARAKELNQRTSSFVMRRSSQLLLQYLPDKVEQVLFVPLTPMQAELYRAMLRSKQVRAVLSRGSGGPNDALSLQCINSLKKLANHPALVYDECRNQEAPGEVKSAFSLFPENYVPVANMSDVTQSSKLAVLAHLLAAIKQAGQKVVVVSNYIQTLDMLQKFLHSKGWQWLRLDGTTSAADRPNIVDRFNSNYASENFVFLLSSKAGGVGLNLVGGSRLILFDPDWNPATDLQAMSRVWRDGQKSTVYIYRLLATATIDEKIYQRQIRKNELSVSVMQKEKGAGASASESGAAAAASSSSMRNFDAKSLKDIFSYRDVTACETRDVLRKDRSEDEREQIDEVMGQFQTDLKKAMDPLLQSVPSHLVSAFLNRVSSLEENQRLLELESARAQKKRLAALAKENGAEDEGDKDKPLTLDEDEDLGDDDDDEDDDAAAPAAAAGGNKENHAAHGNARDSEEEDEDEGEAEFGVPLPRSSSSSTAAAAASAPAAASSASASSAPSKRTAKFNAPRPSPGGSRAGRSAGPRVPAVSSVAWPTEEEEEAAAEAEAAAMDMGTTGDVVPLERGGLSLCGDDEDGDEDSGALFAPRRASSRDSSPQKQKRGRKRIFEEDEGEDENEDKAQSAIPPEQSAAAMEDVDVEFAAVAPARTASQLSDASAAVEAALQAALAPVRSSLMDNAAAAAVPPPSPVFVTLDTISARDDEEPTSRSNKANKRK